MHAIRVLILTFCAVIFFSASSAQANFRGINQPQSRTQRGNANGPRSKGVLQRNNRLSAKQGGFRDRQRQQQQERTRSFIARHTRHLRNTAPTTNEVTPVVHTTTRDNEPIVQEGVYSGAAREFRSWARSNLRAGLVGAVVSIGAFAASIFTNDPATHEMAVVVTGYATGTGVGGFGVSAAFTAIANKFQRMSDRESTY